MKPCGLNVEVTNASPFDLSINFNLSMGGGLALLGSSGSGKTSLLKIIAGLHKKANATIYFNSTLWQNTTKHLPAKKRPIAYLSQTPALFEHFNVVRNLEIFSRSSKDFSDWLFDAFMIKDLLNKKPSQLSGGEKQKVCLLRALLQRPQLLLLDEPFNGIDASSKEFLEICIKQYQNRYGCSLIFVSHDITESKRLCSQAIVMSQGKTIDNGSLAYISANPKNLESARFFGFRNYLPTSIEDTKPNELVCRIAGKLVYLPSSEVNFNRGDKAYVLIKNQHFEADSADLSLDIENSQILELEHEKKIICNIEKYKEFRLIFPLEKTRRIESVKKIFLKKEELSLIHE